MSKHKKNTARVSDPHFYTIPEPFETAPLFSPWLGHGQMGELLEISDSKAPIGRLYYLHELAAQSIQCCKDAGEIWECGVYRGETAIFLGAVASKYGAKLRLFDTFSGMPQTRLDKDFHIAGDFADTSVDLVKSRLKRIPKLESQLHPGFIPESFIGCEPTRICFAHIDLDIYQSILDALDFIMPRLLIGGTIVFDDYGWASCPGAREAVDMYFSSRLERVIVLPTGQSFVLKLKD